MPIGKADSRSSRSRHSSTRWRAARPSATCRIRLGIYLAESHADSRRAIKLLEGLSAEDVEALNGLGVAYGDARPQR